MRERRPEDWRVDLAERHGLEAEVAAALDAHPQLLRLRTSTAALDRLDYQLLGPGERLCELELKAKRQPYKGWGRYWPAVADEDIFILDELALRRVLDAGRHAFLLVRDMPMDRWCLWSTMELVLTSKIRVGRQLAGGRRVVKGKILLDLSSAAATQSTLAAALSQLTSMVGLIDRRWTDIGPWPWSEQRASIAAYGGSQR